MANYKVGDKVVDEGELKFLFNPYWKDSKRKNLIQTVTEANEELFTVYDNKGYYDTTLQNALSCGANEFLAFYQGSGSSRSWCSKKRLLHLEQDKERIREIVSKNGKTQHYKEMDSYSREIDGLIAEKRKKRVEYQNELKINSELLGIEL